MAATLQVIYTIGDDTHFDDDYYGNTHMSLVAEHMGAHLQSASASKGLAGGPDTPPSIYAIATITFADMDTLNTAMAAAGPVVADIPNFTNTQPTMLIGETLT